MNERLQRHLPWGSFVSGSPLVPGSGWRKSHADGGALRVAHVLVFALVWIFASDWILELFVPNHADFAKYQTYKGSLFVAVTALLVYWLVRGQMGVVIRARDFEARVADAFRTTKERQHSPSMPLSSAIGSMNSQAKSSSVTIVRRFTSACLPSYKRRDYCPEFTPMTGRRLCSARKKS